MYQINFYICIAKSRKCGFLWNNSTHFHNLWLWGTIKAINHNLLAFNKLVKI